MLLLRRFVGKAGRWATRRCALALGLATALLVAPGRAQSEKDGGAGITLGKSAAAKDLGLPIYGLQSWHKAASHVVAIHANGQGSLFPLVCVEAHGGDDKEAL